MTTLAECSTYSPFPSFARQSPRWRQQLSVTCQYELIKLFLSLRSFFIPPTCTHTSVCFLSLLRVVGCDTALCCSTVTTKTRIDWMTDTGTHPEITSVQVTKPCWWNALLAHSLCGVDQWAGCWPLPGVTTQAHNKANSHTQARWCPLRRDGLKMEGLEQSGRRRLMLHRSGHTNHAGDCGSIYSRRYPSIGLIVHRPDSSLLGSNRRERMICVCVSTSFTLTVSVLCYINTGAGVCHPLYQDIISHHSTAL